MPVNTNSIIKNLEPGDIVLEHRHIKAYVSYVVEGSYWERSIDGVFNCSAGCVIVHPPMHSHSNTAGQSGARILNFSVPDGTFSLGDYGCYDIKNTDKVQLEQRLKSDIANTVQDLSIYALKSEHLKHLDWLINLTAELSTSGPDPKTIQQFGTEMGLTAAHISRRFKAAMGFGPAAFRNEFRIRHAIYLLKTGCSPSQVAYATGFSDHSHLCRTMRNSIGLSPRTLANFRF